jgi:hypothetical protein
MNGASKCGGRPQAVRSFRAWCEVSALLLGAVLSGCVSMGGGLAKGDDRPAWINEPGDGVSASAGDHVRGRQAQEELAISRARDEYARRYGVRVSNQMSSEMAVAGGRMSSTSQSNSTQSVDNKEVQAQVKAKWLDKATGALWVWLVPAGK